MHIRNAIPKKCEVPVDDIWFEIHHLITINTAQLKVKYFAVLEKRSMPAF